jgi:hypothetical protein
MLVGLFLDTCIVHRRLRWVVGLAISTTFDEDVTLLLDLVSLRYTFRASFREKLLSQLGQGNGLTAR